MAPHNLSSREEHSGRGGSGAAAMPRPLQTSSSQHTRRVLSKGVRFKPSSCLLGQLHSSSAGFSMTFSSTFLQKSDNILNWISRFSKLIFVPIKKKKGKKRMSKRTCDSCLGL